MDKKPIKLSRKKYTFAKRDDKNTSNIVSVEDTVSAAQGVVHTGGVIRTAVGGTRSSTGRIQTAIKNGVRVGSVKDVGGAAVSVGAAANDTTVDSIKESGRSLLRTKIDKSTTTDTGTEAVKQALTEVRYTDNARKAIYNTAQGGIKTARSVKETPKAVKSDVQKLREKIIRKNRAKQAESAKKKGKAAVKAAGVIGKAVTSKGFIVIALGGGLILLVVTLISGFFSMIISAISSMFSWMMPRDGTSQYDYLQAYHTQVREIQSSLQEDIDAECEYTPEYRYDGTEITSLNQYGNLTLAVDENAVIAACAVKEYLVGNDTISNETIIEVIENFYTFSHSTERDYCPDHDCMKDEDVELRVADRDFYVSSREYVPSSDRYAVTFRGTCYGHTSSVWTDLTIATSWGTITGSAYAGVSGSDWQITYNIGSDGYRDIIWDDITIKTTTVYCNNPNHTIYHGEVENLDVETGLAHMGFTTDQESMFWTYYACLERGGF